MSSPAMSSFLALRITPMLNIIIGILFIAGGLSGKVALKGTDSSMALAAVGGGLLIWGIVQVVKGRRAQE